MEAGSAPTSVMAASATAVATTATMPVVDPTLTTTASSGVYDDERRRPRVAKFLIIFVLVVAGIGALSYAGWLLLRTKSHEVPELSGVSETVAMSEIEGNDWRVNTERQRDDDFPEPDTVIRTTPVAGVILDEGSEFTLVVSDGPEFRTLPEFNDLVLDDAISAAEELGLVGVAASKRRFSETVPEGSVIAWTVQGSDGLVAGAKILPGETVEFTVSKGPRPRTVPNLINLDVQDASAAIEDLQLKFRQGDEVFSDEIEPGHVVSQVPAPDSKVERGSQVRVQVSKGPDVVAFPDIVGLRYQRAERRLIRAGYTIGAVLGTTDGTVISASIHGSSADVGEIHRRGTEVDIVSL